METKNYSLFKTVLALGLGFAVVSGTPFAASAATADYYKCNDRVGGEYNYGRAPQACNANAFGDDKYVTGNYGQLIYSDTAASTERSRYVDEMNAVIKEAAAYYLKKRKPTVSSTEVSWWVLGIQATASHESYWSHYRKATDARLKMMRGDYGHGHGMMQIDDRAHFPAVTNGTAWNLITNLTYAMDIFYKNWEKAPSQTCVKSATNYEARIRASWAAYNGGSGKICRWTDPNDKWAQNDKNFYTHYSKRLWEKYGTNPNKKASIDVACLIEKKENCPAPGSGTEAPALKSGVLYKSSAGPYCVISNSKASCVTEARDAICLKQISPYSVDEATAVKDTVLASYSPANQDRHALCKSYESTLYPVGTNIEIQKNTNLRASPGGGIVSMVPKDQVVTVLDFELRSAPDNERYYKVNYQGKEGYVFGGNKTDYLTWAVVATNSNLPSTLAKAGEYVKVVNSAGVNHRTTPGGTLIRLIPKGTQLQVQEVFIEDSNNKVYYRVTYQGQTGYIYTGLLLPTDTTSEWTEVQR
ncbi:MAG: SH3 domain-containing protein [Bdellovibrionales bacterium]|nr:SH3 domain-containing protein [Bdellovibrionales bacterium]